MEVDQQNVTEIFAHRQMHGVLSEVSAMYQPYVEKLFNTDVTIVEEGLKQIKNFVIGNNKQKTNFIVLGAVPRLVYLIQQDSSDIATKTHCAVILGSLAKGLDANVKSLLDYGVLDVMLYGLRQSDLKFYEACLRCVRTIVNTPDNGELIFVDVSIIPIILDSINKSMCTQECTCEIITHCCTTRHHQDLLYDLRAIDYLTDLLASNVVRVQTKALQAIAVLCYKNITVCQSVLVAYVRTKNIMNLLTEMLSRGQSIEIQINAAKCLTYVYRSGVEEGLDHKVIYKKVLPCLVRMCDSSRNIEERVVGAKTLAYLIEAKPELQRIALICEQFPKKLLAYTRHPTVTDTQNIAEIRRFKHELGHGNDLLEAVFLAYAALLSNDEDMRDLVATDSLVQNLVEALSNNSSPVRIAALQCLLSLSRSVQILRTIFEDMEVWKPVLKIVQEQTVADGVIITESERSAASALICNLLLEFSPCKSKLLGASILHILKSWCENDSCLDLKRNAIWGFLNVTFQAELNLKLEVMNLLGPDILFMLLTSVDYDIVVKTLGVLNNVLTNKEHTDTVMALHGDTVMQACAIVIESTTLPAPSPWSGLGERDVAASIHTYALCVLGCVAAGDGATTVRTFLHENDNFLRKLVSFMNQSDDELQTAAVACVCTLCRTDENGSVERQEKLKELGAIEALHKLTTNTGGPLFDRVKMTLHLLQQKGNL